MDQRDEDKESENEYGGVKTNKKSENEKENEHTSRMKMSKEEWKGMKLQTK